MTVVDGSILKKYLILVTWEKKKLEDIIFMQVLHQCNNINTKTHFYTDDFFWIILHLK